MRTPHWSWILVVGITLSAHAVADGDPSSRDIGRPVTIAALPIGCGGDYAVKLPLALELLALAGAQGVDIACLPEEFSGGNAEPINGPTVAAAAEVAAKYKMYVICPIRELDGEREFNTAVLIDREG